MQNNMDLIFRKAKEGDIPNIVKMLADDELGSKREDYKVPLPKTYYDAFQNIFQDLQKHVSDSGRRFLTCSRETSAGCRGHGFPNGFGG